MLIMKMKLPKEEKKHIVNEISKVFNDPQWFGRSISQQDIDRETKYVLLKHGYRTVKAA